jgi:hypothetical protein
MTELTKRKKEEIKNILNDLKNKWSKGKDLTIYIQEGINTLGDILIEKSLKKEKPVIDFSKATSSELLEYVEILKEWENNSSCLERKDYYDLDRSFNDIIDNIIKEETNFNTIPEQYRTKIWDLAEENHTNDDDFLVKNKFNMLKNLPKYINIFG